MFLPYYYLIEGKCKDGFTYVLYINGGHPTSGILYPFIITIIVQIHLLRFGSISTKWIMSIFG